MISNEIGVVHADLCGGFENVVETGTAENGGGLNHDLDGTATGNAVNLNAAAPSSIRGIVYRYEYVGDEEDLKGKSYVGTTPKEEKRRQSWNNWSNAYAGKKMKEARERSKPKDWSYEVLKEGYFSTMKDYEIWAKQYEKAFIQKYDSYKNGFNGNKGGTGRGFLTQEEKDRVGMQHKGMKHTDETKELISQQLIGRKLSQNTCDKISDALTGREFTPEHRQHLSESMKKLYENGGYPVKATEGAAKWRAEHPGHLKGRKMPQSAIDKKAQTMREKGNCIKVTDSDGNVTCYPCQTDAAKATGLKDGSVKYALDHTGKHVKSGYRFERINGDEYKEWKNQNQNP